MLESGPVLSLDLHSKLGSFGCGSFHHLGLVKAHAPPAQPCQWRGKGLHAQASCVSIA